MIRDHAMLFGQSGGLVGVVTERIGAEDGAGPGGAPNDRPAIVILNTGVTHRVGPNRMSTTWSRRLAVAGHCVLRFDLPGVGDSERRHDSLPPMEAALAAIREAVDWLAASRGIDRVVLAGLCSGADQCLLYAGTDRRVAGIVLMDSSIPPTRRFYRRYIFEKLLDLRDWRQTLRKVTGRLAAARRREERKLLADFWKYAPMPLNDPKVHEILTDAYNAALASDVKILAIFTGGIAFQHNYREQLIDAFPEISFGKNLQLEYFESSDHVFTLEAQRSRLFAVTEAWLARTEFKPVVPRRAGSIEACAESAVGCSDRVSVEF